MIPFLLFVFLCLILFICMGNYLVRFSLYRKNKKFLHTNIQDLPPVENHASSELEQWLSHVMVKEERILSHDGLALYANIYDQDPSHQWVIAVHGYRGNRRMMAPFAKIFHEKGFHILCPDLRGHGNSQGEYIGMGWPDRKDIVSWIEKIIEKDEQAEIVLFGVSMGAATVMMTSGEKLPPHVKCIIEDCGYTSVYDQFRYQIKRMFHLPSFPFLPIARFIARNKTGMDIYTASAVKQIQKCTLPILFIHGTKDSFVPSSMAEILYHNKKGAKDILLIEGAKHGKAFTTEPILYEKTIIQFIEKYMPACE